MPFVDFRCECGKEEEVFFNHMGPFEHICECGRDMKRVWNVTPFSFEFWYGWDAGIGAYVDNRRQRTELMRKKGLVKLD